MAPHEDPSQDRADEPVGGAAIKEELQGPSPSSVNLCFNIAGGLQQDGAVDVDQCDGRTVKREQASV